MSKDENKFQRVDWTGDGWQPSDDDDEHGLPVQPPRGPGLSGADLELLTLGAKAIGAVRVEVVEGENWLNLHFADGSTMWNWNPLLHGDDTFNLQVKLRMDVRVGTQNHTVTVGWGAGLGCVEEVFDSDDSAAARRGRDREGHAMKAMIRARPLTREQLMERMEQYHLQLAPIVRHMAVIDSLRPPPQILLHPDGRMEIGERAALPHELQKTWDDLQALIEEIRRSLFPNSDESMG